MENKPIAFFFGSEIKKFDFNNQTISPVDQYGFSVNRVYMVNEPITLIGGDKDKTKNLSLNPHDLFITLQRYNDNLHEWEYYRIPIHSEELVELLTMWKKEYEENKNNKNSCSNENDCCPKAFDLF